MYILIPIPISVEKVEDSSYTYPYLVNAGIPRQNEDGFGQYPRGRFICHLYVRVDLDSFLWILVSNSIIFIKNLLFIFPF